MKFSFKNYVLIGLISAALSTSLLMAPGYGMEDAPEWTKSALIVKKNGEPIMEIGKCEDRHSPYSTFKVALALMGFDEGILQDKNFPVWPFKQEYEKIFQDWYTHEKGSDFQWCQDHTPASFMKYSVVWFSHQITEQLRAEKFQEYVSKFHYGNEDVSGTPAQHDGLLNSWLGTSLEISPREQVEFLEKLFAESLVVSKNAQEKTREIMDREEEWKGWKLYGKTGSGSDDTGWFIGWVEKEEERIFFAQYIDVTDPNLDQTGLSVHKSVGLKAKEIAKRNLAKLLY